MPRPRARRPRPAPRAPPPPLPPPHLATLHGVGPPLPRLPDSGGALRARAVAPGVQLGEAPGEGPCRLVGRPGRELEVERLDALELGPVPGLGAERPALGGEQRAIGALDLR